MPFGKKVIGAHAPRIDALKEDDFWWWYRQSVVKSEMIDHGPGIPSFFVLRDRLVQETHTAHLTKKGTDDAIPQALDLYKEVYEDLLAVPVVKGQKSSLANREASLVLIGAYVNETVILLCVHILEQCIEGAICRGLGQCCSTAHGIKVPDPSILSIPSSEGQQFFHVWQNSWHFSSRASGIMMAIHGDNEGLVLPPNLAEYQAILILHGSSKRKQEYQTIVNEYVSIKSKLAALHWRTEVDLRDGYSAGWKLHEWIIRGAPLCIILGIKELSGQHATVYRRDIPKESRKINIPLTEIPATVLKLLEDLQERLLQKARVAFSSRQREVTDWDEFTYHIRGRKEVGNVGI
ncbi:class II aaRS and biotin synthetase [Aspergillus affinis]|uniref:class II aaRS and biotin synthetase n=1 Tax=Aspergillus affinis TaxID=1070780 RepID=UPI0022FECFA6|nr:class II aaRS and biotin synthetase [Aspergillus affinis]KAI9046004.1 class II aaRS and biotin synthetase [Aspergillus affinis]